MPHRITSVRNGGVSKSDVSAALAVGWSRAVRATGKGTFADKIDSSTKTIDRALIGETLPELHTALASLSADPTALDEVAALYGVRFCPLTVQAANDLELVGNLSQTVTEFLHRLSDGTRCHRDTAILADLFRRVIPQMQAIVDEHDRRVA